MGGEVQNDPKCRHAEGDGRKRQENLNGRIGASDAVLPSVEFTRRPFVERRPVAPHRIALSSAPDPPQRVGQRNRDEATPSEPLRRYLLPRLEILPRIVRSRA
jgi:hypothetical protein